VAVLVLEAVVPTTAAIAVADSKATRLGSGRMLKNSNICKESKCTCKVTDVRQAKQAFFQKGNEVHLKHFRPDLATEMVADRWDWSNISAFCQIKGLQFHLGYLFARRSFSSQLSDQHT
jgi:hypothetical protein